MTSQKGAKIQPVRGTQDILPDKTPSFRHIENKALEIAERYGFQEISTPLIEFTEVFTRTLGDTSDIVTKEMYTFNDLSGENITLRPEGTAGVARAFLSNGLAQNLPLKVFYSGPMFRYERPQKGRRRQFKQVGIELIGIDGSQADIEVISLGNHFLRELGLEDSFTIELNSLGDPDSRSEYKKALLEYLSAHKKNLSPNSIKRLEKNPLRILDSKDKEDQKITADAPLISNSLNDKSKKFFEEIRTGLEKLNISYVINERLVRGLDYYNHTAFEFVSQSLGAQGALLAGGRYDGLIKQMGGPDTPGIGWAAGIERLEMLLKDFPKKRRPISIIPGDSSLNEKASIISNDLRQSGYTIDFAYSGNMKKRLKNSNKVNACACIILDKEAVKDGNCILRDMDRGEQILIDSNNLSYHLKKYK